MDLEQLGKRDRLLQGLLQQSQQWRRLDREVKQILPPNLRPHFQTACVEQGRLVLLASNNMASSRLKMIMPSLLPQLQSIRSDIREVSIRMVPKTPEAERVNRLSLSDRAVVGFEQTAAQLEERHPDLARALARLAKKHKRG